MNKSLLLITLGILWILNSCQKNQNPKQETLGESIESTDTTISSGIAPVVDKLGEQIQVDTLTISDRFMLSDRFLSHIELDFALTSLVINDSSQISVIDEICAVSIMPDTTWINQQQLKMGDNWDEIVSDNLYYEHLAIEALKKNEIPTFYNLREKRYIRFIKIDNSSVLIDLTKMKDGWGLILFNGDDNPVLWSDTDIDEELKEIYNK
jgi:hypothetical protein